MAARHFLKIRMIQKNTEEIMFEETRRRPSPGECYRHFKNKLYQVMGIAIHSETGEELVIYQALYGDFRLYARPLSMFLSPVDREKYPDVRQQYRFELVDKASLLDQEDEKETDDSVEEESETIQGSGNFILRFFDEDTLEGKWELLETEGDSVDRDTLEIIYSGMEIPLIGSTAEELCYNLKRYLETLMKYGGGRFRR